MRSLCLILGLVLLAATPISAEEGQEDGTLLGEVRISMNTEYGSVLVNDMDWGAVEFESNGRVLVVKNLRMDGCPYRIAVTPADDTLVPKDVNVDRKDFRKKRKGRTLYLVANKKARFEKRKGAKPATPDAPEEDKPKPPPEEEDEL